MNLLSKLPFRIEPLGRHDRSEFCSGSEPLDRYFRTQVSQDVRRRVTACYVAVSCDDDWVAGFYTLSAAQVCLRQLPQQLQKKLPRYPVVPAVRIGRLAVDRRFQGQGLGSALLVDALFRAINADIAAYAAIVDAKDDRAVAFYRHHGFLDLDPNQRILFIPLARLMETSKLKK